MAVDVLTASIRPVLTYGVFALFVLRKLYSARSGGAVGP